jgi:hypothetical protein
MPTGTPAHPCPCNTHTRCSPWVCRFPLALRVPCRSVRSLRRLRSLVRCRLLFLLSSTVTAGWRATGAPLMPDTPAHAVGAERDRAEIPGRAGSAGRCSGDRGGRTLRGQPSERAYVAAPLPGRGSSGLADRSHRVRHHPWQILAEVESAVCELHRAHPRWGPKRLVFEMGRRGHGRVTRSTVYGRWSAMCGLPPGRSARRSLRRWRSTGCPRKCSPTTGPSLPAGSSGPARRRRCSS